MRTQQGVWSRAASGWSGHRSAPRASTAISIIILLAILGFGAAGAQTAPTEITVHLTFDTEQVEIRHLDGGYDAIRLPGLPVLAGPAEQGNPALPYSSDFVLLPRDMKVTGITARMSDPFTFPGEIVPEFVWVEEGEGPESLPPNGPNESIYEGLDPFPPYDSKLSCQGSYRGLQVANVFVHPFRYVGLTKQLSLYTNVDLTLTLAPRTGEEAAVPRLRPDRRFSRAGYELDWVRRTVRNPEDLQRFYLQAGRGRLGTESVTESNPDAGFRPTDKPSLSGSPVDCVILTNDTSIYRDDIGDMTGAFQEWADWKTSKGTPTVVRTVDWVRENYPGADDPERIRTFLRDAYSYWGTDWLLVGGDVGVVPCRFVATDVADTSWTRTLLSTTDVPGMFYYSNLDGDWNKDHDGMYGEESADGSGFDALPDLWMGQFPVRDAGEAAGMVAKNRAYCRTPDYAGPVPASSYYKKMLMAAGLTNSSGVSDANGILEGEQVRGILHDGLSWTVDRHYSNLIIDDVACNGQNKPCYMTTRDRVVDSGSVTWSFQWAHIINDLQTGGYHGVFHCEHSMPTFLGGPFQHGTSAITPPASECTEYQPTCPSQPTDYCTPWRDACRARYLALNPTQHITRERLRLLTNAPYYGIYATRGSHVNAHDGDAVSESLARNPNGGAIAFFGRTVSWAYGTQSTYSVDVTIWEGMFENGLPFGVALAESRLLSGSVPASLAWHLLGDPEVTPWERAPFAMSATITLDPDGVQGFRLVKVLLQDVFSATPVAGAVVCIAQGDGLWARGETGADGFVTFPRCIIPDDASLVVTATAPGYLPLRRSVLDSEKQGLLAYVEHTWSDAPEPSTTADVLEPGDTVDLDVTLRNVGDDAVAVSALELISIAGSGAMRIDCEFDDAYAPERIRLGPVAGGDYIHPPEFAPTFSVPMHEYGISLLSMAEPVAQPDYDACYLWRGPGQDFRYYLRTNWEQGSGPDEMTATFVIEGGCSDVELLADPEDTIEIDNACPADPDTIAVVFQEDATEDRLVFRAGLPSWIEWADSLHAFSAATFLPGEEEVASYRFRVKPGFADGQPISFAMNWVAVEGGTLGRQFTEFQTTAHAPDVRVLYAQPTVGTGCADSAWSRVEISPYIVNLGSVAAEDITLRCEGVEGTGAFVDSIATVDRLDPGEVQAIDSPILLCTPEQYSFKYDQELVGAVGGEEVLYDRQDRVVAMLSPYNFVDSLGADPCPEGIRVVWSPPPFDPEQFKGYLVFQDADGQVDVVSRIPVGDACRYMVNNPAVVDENGEFIPYRFGVAIEYRSGSLGPVAFTEVCYANPPEKEGWPVVAEKGGIRSIAAANLDADPELEILAAGLVLSGFNVDGTGIGLSGSRTVFTPDTGNEGPEFRPEIAIGALTEGGPARVVVAHNNNKLYCLNPSTWGTVWSKNVNGTGPVIADLDLNGTSEVLLTGTNGWIYAFKNDGTSFRQNAPDGKLVKDEEGATGTIGSVAVANLVGTNPDYLEILQGTKKSRMYCWRADQPAWQDPPTHLYHWRSRVGSGSDIWVGQPVIGDVENLYIGEEVVAARGNEGEESEIFVVSRAGQGNLGYPYHQHRWHGLPGPRLYDQTNGRVSGVALADLGGWGNNLEIIASKDSTGNGTSWPVGTPGLGRHQVIIGYMPSSYRCAEATTHVPCPLSLARCYDWLPQEWRHTSKLGPIAGSPVVADIDGDEKQEIILASFARGVFIWEAEYQSEGDRFDCTAELGWPLELMEEATTPLVVDVDGDGCLELLVGDESGLLHMFSMPGACATTVEWAMAGADAERTGRYQNVFSPRDGAQLSKEAESAAAALEPRPNPFYPRVNLRFQMPYEAKAVVSIYDVHGREIVELYDGNAAAGAHDIAWDGKDRNGQMASSGTYFARFVLAGYEMNKKIVLAK